MSQTERQRPLGRVVCCLFGVWLSLIGSASAIEVSPAYELTEIATNGLPSGGIDVVGGVVFVGIGPFGAGTQSVVRIDPSGETTLATGFNSIAGIRYEPVQDRLIVGDNGLEVGGTTGDTVYVIPAPFGAFPAPLAATQIELIASGSIASVADITLDPSDPTGDSAFVSNSVGPPGEILALDLSTGALSNLYSVPVYAAGLATDQSELFFGESNASPGGGTVFVGPKDASAAATPLATGLEGAFDIVLASDGTLLVTASRFFGPSSLVRLDANTGALLETIADEFDFAGAMAEEDESIYLLEGGVFAQNRILVLPEPGFALAFGVGALALALTQLDGRRRRR